MRDQSQEPRATLDEARSVNWFNFMMMMMMVMMWMMTKTRMMMMMTEMSAAKCFYPIGWGSLSPGSNEERSVDPWTISFCNIAISISHLYVNISSICHLVHPHHP